MALTRREGRDPKLFKSLRQNLDWNPEEKNANWQGGGHTSTPALLLCGEFATMMQLVRHFR